MSKETVPPVLPAAGVLPADSNIPDERQLGSDVQNPNAPKSEVVLVKAPARLDPSVAIPVELSHRDALIAKKRKKGLTKDQAERVADDQIAHEKRLIAASQGKPKTASPKAKA